MPTGLQPGLREHTDQWRESRWWIYVSQNHEKIQLAELNDKSPNRSEAAFHIRIDVDAASYAPLVCASPSSSQRAR